MVELRLPEVARELGLSPTTLYRWLRDGKIKGVRLGGTKAGWRIPLSEVERIKQEGTRG